MVERGRKKDGTIVNTVDTITDLGTLVIIDDPNEEDDIDTMKSESNNNSTLRPYRDEGAKLCMEYKKSTGEIPTLLGRGKLPFSCWIQALLISTINTSVDNLTLTVLFSTLGLCVAYISTHGL